MTNINHPAKSDDNQLDQKIENDNNSPIELNLSIENDDTNNNNNSQSDFYSKQNNEEFYNLIKAQSEEIELLLNQRSDILSLFHKFDNLNSKSDDIISSLTQQLTELKQENAEIQDKLSEMQDLDQSKTDNLNNIYYLLLKKAPLEVLKKIKGNQIPQNLDSSTQGMPENSKEIINLFDEICNQYLVSKKSIQREIILLGHLQNALLFVNNIINSNSLQKSSVDKTYVMTQIARINHFINENYEIEELQPVISLFQKDKPEDQIKAIYAFLDKQENEDKNNDDQISEAASIPFKELCTLFYGVIEVNNLLFSQLDLVNENISNTAYGISLKKKVYELEEENHKLSDYYDSISSKLENISNLLSNTSIEQSSDVFDTIVTLIKKYDSISKQQKDNSNNSNDKLNVPNDYSSESQLLPSGSDINGENKNSKQSKNLSSDQRKVLQRKIGMLTTQNQQFTDKINYLKIMVQKLKRTIANEKKKFSECENSSKAQIDKLKSDLNKIRKENLKRKDQNEKDSNNIKNLIKKNKELADSNKELIDQNTKYQMQEEKNDSLQSKLRSIKLLNDQDQYAEIQTQTQAQENEQNSEENCIKLQQKISTLENECSELKSNNSTLTKEKNDLLSQNIKFKVSEKTLKLKISQMEEFIKYKDDQSRTQSQIREISMNTQKDLRIRELVDQLRNYEFLLKNFVETYFSNIEITKDMSCQEIFSKLEQTIMKTNLYFSQETLKDADEIRKQLNLKKSDSILDSFNQINAKLDQQSKTLEQLNEEKLANSNKIKEAKSNADKMIRYKSKLNEWNKWGVSIYTQVSGVISTSYSPSDIRRALEDILMLAIGHRTLIDKLEILKLEKVFLNNFHEEMSKIEKSSKDQKSSTFSIKPLIYILLFTRKLQKLTSCLSISYIPFVINQPRTKKDETNSPEDSTI